MDERAYKIMVLGRHLILELYECNAEKLDNTTFLQFALQKAADEMGATVLSVNFHPFVPIGVSGVVIIKESHLTIHTWPEYAYAAIDIFTCGIMNMNAAIEYLEIALEAKRSEKKLLTRGKLPI